MARAYQKLQRIGAGETVQLNIGIVGDSVAGKKPKFLLPRFYTAFGQLADSNQTWQAEGDAWEANGSAGKLYDYFLNFTGVYYSLGLGGSVWFGRGGAGILCNRIVIYYVTGPDAGQFKVQRSFWWGSPTTWVDEPGYGLVDANSPTVGWRKLVISSPLSYSTLKIAHIGGGRVKIPVRPIFFNTQDRGVTVRRLDRGGLSLSDAANWNPQFATDYLQELNLDLCFFEAKENPSYYANALESMRALFDGVRPNLEWIFIGSSPLAPVQDPTGTKQIQENAMLRAQAEQHGGFFFDGYPVMVSYSNMLAHGWMLSTDDVHETDAASQVIADEMWKKLGYLIAPALAAAMPDGSPLPPGKAAFGPVSPGSQRNIVLRNTGTIALTGLPLAFTGDAPGDFQATLSSTVTIAPGASLNLPITFLPTDRGMRSAVLHLTPAQPYANPLEVSVTAKNAVGLRAWRLLNFGMEEGSGPTADDGDFDGDGLCNLLEYVAARNPKTPESSAGQLTIGGPLMNFQYMRSKEAVADDLHSFVEWSDTLQPGSWHTDGVVETIIQDGATTQTIRAGIPMGSAPTRFVRLHVSPAD